MTQFYCSKQTVQDSADIIGVSYRDYHICIELPKPWPRNYLAHSEVDEGFKLFLKKCLQRHITVTSTGIASNQSRPQGGQGGRTCYLWRADPIKPRAIRLQGNWQQLIAELERYIIGGDPFPEELLLLKPTVFLCTHGQRDLCCLTFGLKLLEKFSNSSFQDHADIWETSHIGGHRLAPTFMVWPNMQWWGLVQEDEFAAIVLQSQPFAKVSRRYRGNANLADVQTQIAEREVLISKSWKQLGPRDFKLNADLGRSIIETEVGSFAVEKSHTLSLFESCQAKEKVEKTVFRCEKL